MNDIEKFKSLINENTKLVWVKPTNPLMKLADIQEIAAITKRKNSFAVDNTFATPYCRNH
jgi:cystathionine beta-lyase